MAYRGSIVQWLRAAGHRIPGITPNRLHGFSSKHLGRLAYPFNHVRGISQLVRHQQPCQAPFILQRSCTSTASSRTDAVTTADYDDDRDTITVTWDSGVTSEFPAVWLRDNCQCPLCFHESAIARNIVMNTLDVDVKPTELKVSVHYVIRVCAKWMPYTVRCCYNAVDFLTSIH